MFWLNLKGLLTSPYYLKGFVLSLASVAIFFFTLYFFGRQLQLGWLFLTVLFHPRQTGLTAVVGNPALWFRPWFYLWGMIVFASTFLLYLCRTSRIY
jgi:hypothetical protein